MRRVLMVLLTCGAALAAPATASAARELHAPDDRTMPVRPFAQPLDDTVIDTPPGRARASRARAVAAQAQRFFSSDGQGPIRVDLDPAYGPITKERVQPYVDFVAGRAHGRELERLTLVIATPGNLRQICSETALACYFPRLETMIVPGEQTPEGEVPVEYVITHEYGHHVAANRDNDPWSAVAWGPKRWATLEGICAGVASRAYFPGDQEENYVRNPGENFAEAYAQLQYRDRYPWQFDPSLRPSEASFAAIQADVARPWTRNVARRRSGTLTSRRRSKAFQVETTLDGRVKLSLSGPRRADFDLQIVSGGRVVARTRRVGSRDRLTATDCAVRRFEVRVVRRSGSGRFSLRVQTAG